MEPMIELDRVSKRFGGVRALDALTLSIRPGLVTALLGRNGAGKTTAVRLILGLVRADAGEVRVLQGPPGSIARRRRTGVVLQNTALAEDLTVAELLRLFASYHARPLSRPDLLAAVPVEALLARRYGTLSGGQKRLVQVAVALIGDPDLLILDEPTTGLDSEARQAFWSSLRGLTGAGKAILLPTHYLEEADALADRILVLHQGRLIAEGAPEALKARLSGAHIRCRTTLPQPKLASLPGVQSVAQDGAFTRLTAARAEPLLRALLQADADLSELTVSRGSLDDAVAALTQTQTLVTGEAA